MQALQKIFRFARKSRREQLQGIRYHLEETDWYWKFHRPRNDRTAYVIGLWGTGRWYITELIRQNIGERARFYRDGIRFHRGPTSMIYSGHATIRHISRAQALPAVTSRVMEAVRSRYADLIFIYRHPLDSLLSNWIWWRIVYSRQQRACYISQVYKNTDDLCADVDLNFLEFEAFAEGDPDFYAAVPAKPVNSEDQLVPKARDFWLSRNLLRKLSFISNPPRSRCGLRTLSSIHSRSFLRSLKSCR